GDSQVDERVVGGSERAELSCGGERGDRSARGGDGGRADLGLDLPVVLRDQVAVDQLVDRRVGHVEHLPGDDLLARCRLRGDDINVAFPLVDVRQRVVLIGLLRNRGGHASGLLGQGERSRVVTERDVAHGSGQRATLPGQQLELFSEPLGRHHTDAVSRGVQRTGVLDEPLRGNLVTEHSRPVQVTEERVPAVARVVARVPVTGVRTTDLDRSGLVRVSVAGLRGGSGDLGCHLGDLRVTGLDLHQVLNLGGDPGHLLALLLDRAQLVFGQIPLLLDGAAHQTVHARLHRVVLLLLSEQVRVTHRLPPDTRGGYRAPSDRGVDVQRPGCPRRYERRRCRRASGRGAGVQLPTSTLYLKRALGRATAGGPAQAAVSPPVGRLHGR